MNIAERRIGDITIIDLQGNIMFEDGDLELRGAVARVLEAGGTKVILNMGEVPYLDSAGLSELVRSFVAVNKRGGKMVLIDLTRKVQDLLTISKLLTIFETFDSEEAAIRSLETATSTRA
jgi:anti-sigma B factor antagonist